MEFPQDRSDVAAITAYLKGLEAPNEIRAAMMTLGEPQFELSLFFTLEEEALVCVAGRVAGCPVEALFDLRLPLDSKSVLGRAVSLGSARVGPLRGDPGLLSLYAQLGRAEPPKVMIEPLRVGMDIKGLFLGERGSAPLSHREASEMRRLLAPVARLLSKLDGPLLADPLAASMSAAPLVQAALEGAEEVAELLDDGVELLDVEPEPEVELEPAPVQVEPAPVPVEPAPVQVEPAPVQVEPEPVHVEPVPVQVEPVPVEPAPTHPDTRPKLSMASLFGEPSPPLPEVTPPTPEGPSSAQQRAELTMRALFGAEPPQPTVSRGAKPSLVVTRSPKTPQPGRLSMESLFGLQSPQPDPPTPAAPSPRPQTTQAPLDPTHALLGGLPSDPIFSGPTTTPPKPAQGKPATHRPISSSQVHTPPRTVEPIFDGEPKVRPRPSTTPPSLGRSLSDTPLFEPPSAPTHTPHATGRVISINTLSAPTALVAPPTPTAPPQGLSPEILNAVAVVQSEEGEARREAEMFLLQEGEAALWALSQVFPGQLLVDLKAAPLMSVPVAQHSRVLQMMTLFGAAAAPHLERLCAHESAQVRYYAVYAFSAIRSPGALRTIKLALFDSDQGVRDMAVAVIDRYRNGPAFDELINSLCQLLAEGRLSQQRLAVEMLGRLRGAGGFGHLVAALEIPQLALEARRALRLISRQDLGEEAWRWISWFEVNGDRPRVEWLLESLEHDYEELREAAFEELRGLVQKDFGYSAGASQRERGIAVGRWRRWWAESGASQFSRYR
ncbi:hypothetical protein KJ940_11220 [Myxococcota bacterium]|nr:hypothetical protein [Myxococcota bacterium]